MTKLVVKGITFLTVLFIAMGLAGTIDREIETMETQREITETALKEADLW